ncbi:SulP family inorganic anion transporter, partial [Bariatricus massiliensis]|uniref:SulP family inorganic anion transporter n=1 Tax=Bariatricus massiliensis TaxID=1745713 RepID=UPI002221FB4C
VHVVGDVPTGLPIPSIPIVDVSLWSGIITGGLAIAAVGIAEGLAAVRTFAPSGAVDPETDNEEFVAHGAADLASG